MKILLLDPAFAAVPIHDYLSTVADEVWTIGSRANDPLAAAHQEYWINGDYSDIGFVQREIERGKFDAVVPGCTDVSMKTFAHIGGSRWYNYTIETDSILNNKVMFRAMCFELGLPAPRAAIPNRLPDKGRYICKPADSFSGRGVSVFDAANSSMVSQAFSSARDASPSKQVVCEEFVAGELFSYTAFIEAGKVIAEYVVREGSRYDQFAVDTSYLYEELKQSHLQELRKAVEAVGRRLNLCDGLLHTQFIDSGERVAILEMTRRCPGDLYSRLIEESTGLPYAGAYASYFIGQRLTRRDFSRRYILRHTIKQKDSDFFRGLNFDLGSENARLVPVVRLGEPMDRTKLTRTGLAFLELPNKVELEKRFRNIISKEKSCLN